MSLTRRFVAYLVVVHLQFALIAWFVLRAEHRAWLLAVEALFAASLLFGLGLLRRMRRGLEPLESASRLLGEGEFTTRVREVGQPEVDRLVGVYNRMADALREERTRNEEQQGLLARILAASPSGVVMLDFEQRVSFANGAALRLLGRVEPELLGLRLEDAGSPLASALAALPAGEVAVVPLAGARRIRCHRGRFVDRGFPRSFLLLEELTEELRQSEKAAYEKLVRMMSHEVGNTVGAGRSLLESCLAFAERLPAADRPTFVEALSVVISRLGQLQEFTAGFAEVVRLPPARLGPCDLAPVVRAVVTLLRPVAESGGVELRLVADDGVPFVRADRTQLEQALVNVGKNAIEAAGRGGCVTVRLDTSGGRAGREDAASARAGREDETGARARLVLEDTGAGIPPDTAAQLFTPFFSTKPGGQGIGLTLVQEVLRQHGCEFSLEGPPGGPTRFSILFPAASSAA